MTVATMARSKMKLCQARIGALPVANGTCFRIWAPAADRIDVVVEASNGQTVMQMLGRSEEGMHTAWVASVGHGDRYRYRVNRQGMYPDPASRFQPEGIHGPSEIVDPSRFSWSDADWQGGDLDDLVLYKLNVGTFTAAGTFAAAGERLPTLKNRGVSAIEVASVVEVSDHRECSHDGINLFAPARCYGRPHDLRQFVNKAHGLGLVVILDVVYNDAGSGDDYLGIYAGHFVRRRAKSAWDSASHVDDPNHRHAREFFIENAIHWVREYHFDGLHFDATHSVFDEDRRHFLSELTERVCHSDSNRRAHIIAEDQCGLVRMIPERVTLA